MLKHALFILVLSQGISGDAPKDDALKKEAQRLQGKWTCVSIETRGDKLVGQDFKDCKADFTFNPDNLVVKSANKTETWSFRIDPASNPKSIDVIFENEEGKKQTARGIFEVEGDKLTLCWSLNDEARPKEFKSKPKSSIAVIVLKRAKN